MKRNAGIELQGDTSVSSSLLPSYSSIPIYGGWKSKLDIPGVKIILTCSPKWVHLNLDLRLNLG